MATTLVPPDARSRTSPSMGVIAGSTSCSNCSDVVLPGNIIGRRLGPLQRRAERRFACGDGAPRLHVGLMSRGALQTARPMGNSQEALSTGTVVRVAAERKTA